MTENQLRYIVRENNHRCAILTNYYEPVNWLNDYDNIKDDLKEFSRKLLKRISLSTNCIRYYMLKDDIQSGQYHLSRSREDCYNGLDSELHNTDTLFKIISDINLIQEQLLFITVDLGYLLDYSDINKSIDKMKNISRNFNHHIIQSLINGYVLKYELSWTIYRGLLYLNPHIHILLSVDKIFSDNLISSLEKYFTKYVDKPKTDINIKLVQPDEKSLKTISYYIVKDVFKSIFHYSDRKHIQDKYKIPMPHVVFVLSKLKQVRFIHSYKSLKFPLYKRG